jgi:hypothetical protein
MMKKLIVIFLILPSFAWSADKIQGNACYTYGDSESLVQGEQFAKTLAIRNAIESYSVFIESTTSIQDLQLSSDLIKTISAAQVRNLKVLKRLASGHKLCFTVEGVVEPIEIQQAIKKFMSAKNENANVRVQDNGWLKIVDIAEEGMTEEKFNKLSAKLKKQVRKEDSTPRRLYIKYQFLKPCIATTKWAEYTEILTPEFNRLIDATANKRTYKMSPIANAALAVTIMARALEKNNKKDYDELMLLYRKSCKEDGIDPDEFLQDMWLLPRFRCDYRVRVFVTIYSKDGTEITTLDTIPYALLIDDRKRKTDMVPGETSYIEFMIPDNTATWTVWLPK